MQGGIHEISIAIDMDTMDIPFDDGFLALDFFVVGQFVDFRADEEEQKPYDFPEGGTFEDAEVH